MTEENSYKGQTKVQNSRVSNRRSRELKHSTRRFVKNFVDTRSKGQANLVMPFFVYTVTVCLMILCMADTMSCLIVYAGLIWYTNCVQPRPAF
jgi:hypothetical protein